MILTATNERVQSYLQANTPPSKKAKEIRLDKFKHLIEKAGDFLTELFPNKQGQVLDEIVYLTSGCGIAKIGADRLAERADVSERTVSTAVKKLKETGQFIVARINSSRAGKYIFVDKLHVNFKEIMRVVFNVDATQIATLKNAQSPDNTGQNNSKSGSNHSISFKTRSLNNINASLDHEAVQEIQKEIENESPKDLEEQKTLMDQYATNEYQQMYFEVMNMFPLHKDISNNLYKMALRVGSDATNKHFHAAKTATFELNMQLHQRTTTIKESVVALFTTMYNEELNKPELPSANETIKNHENKVVFYNWLDERETEPEIIQPTMPNHKYFYNWLEE